VHCGAGIAVLAAMPSLPIALLCCVALAASVWFARRRHTLGAGQSVVAAAVWHSDGDWHLEAADGSRTEAKLLPSTFIHPRLIVLHFKPVRGGRRFLVLCQDSLSAPTLRRLHARLRVNASNADEAV
jgi:hypothetical protein